MASSPTEKLKKIADRQLARSLPLCQAPGAGGTWNRDGTIVFARNGEQLASSAVPAQGGAPTPVDDVGQVSDATTTHRWPAFLPDGRRFLFTPYRRPTAVHGRYESPRSTPIASTTSWEAHSNAIYASGSLIFSQGRHPARPAGR